MIIIIMVLKFQNSKAVLLEPSELKLRSQPAAAQGSFRAETQHDVDNFLHV